MAIEKQDLNKFLEFREKNPNGNSCAILGDVNIYDRSIESFKELMEFDIIDTFDIMGNPTHKIDLNYKLSDDFYNKYDWVIDAGTTHCCFDVSQVLENILFMLKDEGCVIHTTGLAGYYGRSFYSIHPALYRDFYKANDIEIIAMATRTNVTPNTPWTSMHPELTYLDSISSTHMTFRENNEKLAPKVDVDMVIDRETGEIKGLGLTTSSYGGATEDCMLLCHCKRASRKKFVKPVPQHYIDSNGK